MGIKITPDLDATKKPRKKKASEKTKHTDEERCMKEYLIYIENEVNPARVKAGLEPMNESVVIECYQILNDFYKNW